MASAEERTEQQAGDRQDLSAADSTRGRKRVLVAGVIGAVLALAGIAADAFLVSGDSGNDDDRSKRRADLYPAGGKVPARELTDLRRATAAAGCELRSVKIRSRAHVDGAVVYPTRPPTGGNHFGVPADDGIYTDAPQRRRSSTVSSTGA